MQKEIIFLFLLVTFIKGEEINNKPIHSFAFGSSFFGRDAENLDIFKTISQRNPDFFIWAGNAVYVDTPNLLHYYSPTFDTDWGFVSSMFSAAKKVSYYSTFRHEKEILGVWNDHDFGVLHGNKNNENKEKMKNYYLDFLEVSKDDPRYSKGRGLYSTYTYGSDFKSVRVILLDVRYYKDSNDILGQEQWTWLEEVFSQSKETFTFIVSPTQVLPINRIATEAWDKSSRRKLFDLINKYKKDGIILLSGGSGLGQVLKTYCVLPKVGYNLFELSSSGMSSSMSSTMTYVYDNILPNSYNNEESFNGINFGEVEFIWGDSKESSSVSLSIYDINNIKQRSVTLSYNDLSYNKDSIDESKNSFFSTSCAKRIDKRFKGPIEFVLYYYENLSQLWIGLGYVVVLLTLCHFLSSIKGAFTLGVFTIIVYGAVALYLDTIAKKKQLEFYNKYVSK